jgi:hypothetical protein
MKIQAVSDTRKRDMTYNADKIPVVSTVTARPI